MNEQEQISQLSALFDGELPPPQAQMATRRALRDPAMRKSWERYALIGACLRGDPVRAGASVADRVQARLAAERELNVSPLPVRPGQVRGSTGRASLFGRGALGGAIAAGVAALSIFVVRGIGLPGSSGGDPALMAQNAPPAAQGMAQGGAPGSYTTPGADSPAQWRPLDASLGQFLVAHSEEAASALRSSYGQVAGGMAMTEDQISALR